MKKMIILLLIIILVLLASVFVYFFVGWAPKQQKITWGVNFSQMQAEALKLDWKKMYLAMLEDLGATHIKLITNWDFVEGKKDHFYFDDIDWQVQQAESHNAKMVYVVGLKTGRWPECHMPGWANGLSKQEQQDELFSYVKQIITRYKGSSAITTWQVENEPLFNFGECPSWYYQNDDFLKKEVALVKSLDPTRPVIVSDSGEQSMWFNVAKIGDIVGVTMYRNVWFHLSDSLGFYVTYPIAPIFYYRRAQIINYFFHKPVISIELQAEPWLYKPFDMVSVAEQEKSMDLNRFKTNIEYARQTGLDTFYFWGTEWWYWLKETQDRPEIWDEAKKLFVN